MRARLSIRKLPPLECARGPRRSWKIMDAHLANWIQRVAVTQTIAAVQPGQEFIERAKRDQSSLGDDANSVAQAFSLFNVVGRKNDRSAIRKTARRLLPRPTGVTTDRVRCRSSSNQAMAAGQQRQTNSGCAVAVPPKRADTPSGFGNQI